MKDIKLKILTLKAVLFVSLLVVLDQAVKAVVIDGMALGQHIELMPFLSLYHVQNNGIAFSMLSSLGEWSLIILTMAVIAFVILLWWKVRLQPFLNHFGYLLVLGGAFGNLIDRLRFHYVTDYILISYGDWSFAVFNLADVFITMGAVSIILCELLNSTSARKQSGI